MTLTEQLTKLKELAKRTVDLEQEVDDIFQSCKTEERTRELIAKFNQFQDEYKSH